MCPQGCYLMPCSCVSLGISEPLFPCRIPGTCQVGTQRLAQRSSGQQLGRRTSVQRHGPDSLSARGSRGPQPQMAVCPHRTPPPTPREASHPVLLVHSASARGPCSCLLAHPWNACRSGRETQWALGSIERPGPHIPCKRTQMLFGSERKSWSISG